MYKLALCVEIRPSTPEDTWRSRESPDFPPRTHPAFTNGAGSRRGIGWFPLGIDRGREGLATAICTPGQWARFLFQPETTFTLWFFSSVFQQKMDMMRRYPTVCILFRDLPVEYLVLSDSQRNPIVYTGITVSYRTILQSKPVHSIRVTVSLFRTHTYERRNPVGNRDYIHDICDRWLLNFVPCLTTTHPGQS